MVCLPLAPTGSLTNVFAPLSLRTPFRTAMQGKHQLSIDERKKAINVHRTGLMVGIMLVCLTVNGPGH